MQVSSTEGKKELNRERKREKERERERERMRETRYRKYNMQPYIKVVAMITTDLLTLLWEAIVMMLKCLSFAVLFLLWTSRHTGQVSCSSNFCKGLPSFGQDC